MFYRCFPEFGAIWNGLVVQVGAMLGSIYHPREQAKPDSQNSTKWHGALARAQFRGSSSAQDDDQIDQKSIRNGHQHGSKNWSHIDINLSSNLGGFLEDRAPKLEPQLHRKWVRKPYEKMIENIDEKKSPGEFRVAALGTPKNTLNPLAWGTKNPMEH